MVLAACRAWGRRRTAAALALAACATWSTAAGAQPTQAEPDVKAEARAAAERGSSEFTAGRFAEALDALTRAESLVHAPTHLVMIARAQAKLGRLLAARETYAKLAAEELAPSAPPPFLQARADGASELRDLQQRLPSVLVTIVPATARGVSVTVDDSPFAGAGSGAVLPIDPGAHVFAASSEGLVARPVRATFVEGQRVDVKLVLEPRAGAIPPSIPADASLPPADHGGSAQRVAGFALLGVGGAGMIVGGVFTGLFVVKRHDADAAFDRCGAGCNNAPAAAVRALDRDANTKGTIGAVGLVTGGALATAGVLVLVFTPRPRDAAALRVRPWLGATSAGLDARF